MKPILFFGPDTLDPQAIKKIQAKAKELQDAMRSLDGSSLAILCEQYTRMFELNNYTRTWTAPQAQVFINLDLQELFARVQDAWNGKSKWGRYSIKNIEGLADFKHSTVLAVEEDDEDDNAMIWMILLGYVRELDLYMIEALNDERDVERKA
jgi:hypothetical protein